MRRRFARPRQQGWGCLHLAVRPPPTQGLCLQLEKHDPERRESYDRSRLRAGIWGMMARFCSRWCSSWMTLALPPAVLRQRNFLKTTNHSHRPTRKSTVFTASWIACRCYTTSNCKHSCTSTTNLHS